VGTWVGFGLTDRRSSTPYPNPRGKIRYTTKGGVFSEYIFFLRTCPAHPIRAHTCSAITRRLCGWLGASGTQDLGALRLWQSCRQWRAQPWSCMDAAPGCRLQRRSSANILTAWPGRVAQAPRAGRARAPWSCSPCWRPSSRTARFRDQLQLDDEANSQIADGSDLGTCRPQVTSVGDLPTSSVSAVQLIPETMCSARTPPVKRK
jgi:hypothetical protein